jgi:hypothetical protein
MGLHEYLEGKGLHSEDLPKVMGVFLAAKYSTYLAFMAAGVRWRPMTRLMVRGATRAAEHADPKHVTRFWELRRAATLAGQRGSAAVSRATEGVTTPLRRWYLKYSEKLADGAEKNRAFAAVARALNMDPRNFAVGVVEGMILYKLTFVIHAPLELYLIVTYFQQRRLGQYTTLKDLASDGDLWEDDDDDEGGGGRGSRGGEGGGGGSGSGDERRHAAGKAVGKEGIEAALVSVVPAVAGSSRA